MVALTTMWFTWLFSFFLQSVPHVGNIFKIYDYDVVLSWTSI